MYKQVARRSLNGSPEGGRGRREGGRGRREVATVMSLALLGAAAVSLGTSTPASAAPSSCGLTDPLYTAVANGGGHQELLTPWDGENKAAVANLGYTATPNNWQASTTAKSGLVGVHRLYNPTNNDFLYTYFPNEIKSAVTNYGYTDAGVSFYASASQSSCADTAIYQGVSKQGVGNYSTDPAALTRAGFTSPSVKFYVHTSNTPAPPTVPAPPTFPAVPSPPSVTKPAAATGTPYVDKTSPGWAAYQSETDPTSKRLLYQTAATPTVVWYGDLAMTGGGQLRRQIDAATAAGQIAQIALYGIPNRDCGGWSYGGQPKAAAYRAFIDRMSATVGNSPVVVIVEPDAISFCQNDPVVRAERTALFTYVGQKFQANNPNAALYLHAGSGQLPIDYYAVPALKEGGVQYMRGFALNIASYGTTASQETYGEELVAHLAAAGVPEMHYVIDTSRNGAGRQAGPPGIPNPGCNNTNVVLGARPTSNTTGANADAYLWTKIPGESDGDCGRREARSGQFMPGLAINLVQNSLAARTINYWELPNARATTTAPGHEPSPPAATPTPAPTTPPAVTPAPAPPSLFDLLLLALKSFLNFFGIAIPGLTA